MKTKFNKGEIVMTIQGPKKIIEVKREVVVFEDGFAPKDRVTKINQEWLDKQAK